MNIDYIIDPRVKEVYRDIQKLKNQLNDLEKDEDAKIVVYLPDVYRQCQWVMDENGYGTPTATIDTTNLKDYISDVCKYLKDLKNKLNELKNKGIIKREKHSREQIDIIIPLINPLIKRYKNLPNQERQLPRMINHNI